MSKIDGSWRALGEFPRESVATEPAMKILPDRPEANPASAATLAMPHSSHDVTRHNVTLADLRRIGFGA
jgi:hypothetical protein